LSRVSLVNISDINNYCVDATVFDFETVKTRVEGQPRLGKKLMGISGKSNGDAEQGTDGHHYQHPREVPWRLKKYVHVIRVGDKSLMLTKR
jgi:hypothetical protein